MKKDILYRLPMAGLWCMALILMLAILVAPAAAWIMLIVLSILYPYEYAVEIILLWTVFTFLFYSKINKTHYA